MIYIVNMCVCVCFIKHGRGPRLDLFEGPESCSLALNSISELTKVAAPCTGGLVDSCGVFDDLPIA